MKGNQLKAICSNGHLSNGWKTLNNISHIHNTSNVEWAQSERQ